LKAICPKCGEVIDMDELIACDEQIDEFSLEDLEKRGYEQHKLRH